MIGGADHQRISGQARLLQRGANRDPVLTPALDVVRMVTSVGATALGLGDVVGSIEAGKRADLILIDLNRPHLTPMFDVYAHLVYAVGRDDVNSVLIDGNWVMRDRALTTLDEPRILSEVTELAGRIDRHAKELQQA